MSTNCSATFCLAMDRRTPSVSSGPPSTVTAATRPRLPDGGGRTVVGVALHPYLGVGEERRESGRRGVRPARGQVGRQVGLAAQRFGQAGAAHQERVTRPGYGGAEAEG